MKFHPPALFLRPLPQLLRQPAVEGFLAVSQWQTRFFRRFSQTGFYLIDAHRSSGKKFFQSETFFRRFRMKGERPPLDCDFKILSQFFNTPGNEIAPGSDIIGKDFQYWPGFHFFPPELDTISILFSSYTIFHMNSCEEVTIQSKVGRCYGFRSRVNTRRFPGLGVRALRLES
jgi:hypothetical protein